MRNSFNYSSYRTGSQPDRQVLEFIARQEAECATSSVVIGEIESGVRLMDQGRKQREYLAWLERLVETTEVLPFDLVAARTWARLIVKLQGQGQPLPLKDSMNAATALVHGLTLVTRNGKDFERTGVAVLNPFSDG